MKKKNETYSPICQGIRSPMNPYEANMKQRELSIGTTEVIKGSAPTKAAPLRSPTEPKNPR